jgi:DNA-binding winged helix-turn-helix (wHTH) protein/Tfp pilus assembly protein PilF
MNAHLFTFLDFELNLRSELLKKSGVRVPLASQPLKLLALLVRRAGDLVTREEIQQELWTKGAVVDFEHLVNQYIRQLRAVLGDSRESPTFIETAPRRGYRFIAPVNAVVGAVVPTLSGYPASSELEAPPDLTAPGEVIAPNGEATLAEPGAPSVVGATAVGDLQSSEETSAPTPGVRGRRRYLLASIASVTVILVAVAVIVLVHRASPGSLPAHTRNAGQLQTGKEPSSPSGGVSQRPQEVPSSRVAEARAEYAKGKYFFNQSTVEGFQKSCEYFRQALEADPANALAYNGMADCYLALVANGLVAADEFMPKAKAMATKSIELDGSLAEGHVALGALLLNYEWNWPAAHAELDKAVRLDPAGLDGHFALSNYYRTVGEVDAAADELRKAQALAPASEKGYLMLGWLYVWAGRYADSGEELEKCIEISPYNAMAHFGLALTYAHAGRHPQAMTELLQYLTITKETDIAAQVKRTYQSSGFDRAQRRYSELMAPALVKRHAFPYAIAAEYALLAENSRALDYLEQAYQEHSTLMTHLKVDSSLDNLRGEPRFKRLLEQMKLTDEQLEAAAQLAANRR